MIRKKDAKQTTRSHPISNTHTHTLTLTSAYKHWRMCVYIDVQYQQKPFYRREENGNHDDNEDDTRYITPNDSPGHSRTNCGAYSDGDAVCMCVCARLPNISSRTMCSHNCGHIGISTQNVHSHCDDDDDDGSVARSHKLCEYSQIHHDVTFEKIITNFMCMCLQWASYGRVRERRADTMIHNNLL